MPISTEVARCRGRVAGYKRAIRNGERAPDDSVVTKAQQDLDVATLLSDADKLAAKARKVVDTWPDLTDEQLGRIASVLKATTEGHTRGVPS